MKKTYAILLAAGLVFLTACGSSNTSTDNNTDSAVAPAAAVSATVSKEVVSDQIVEEFVEDEFTFGPADLRCEIPKGFVESEYEGEYYTKKYPKDVSSINQVIIESDENTTLMTKDEYIKMVQVEFAEAYGDNINVNITQFDKMMITGRPALVVMYDYKFKGDTYSVLTYMIYNGTETNYVTYLQGPGADWMDAFIESGNTLHFDDATDGETNG
ncbi:MAG: hypothetical protein K6F53_08655 [Lachnospiraceae bacterium]|nr:hypothetical protein [Lachnospiraceae bacterium]